MRESSAGVHSKRVRFHYWPTDKKLRVCAPKTMQTISIFSFFHSLFLIFFSPNEFNVNIHTPKHMQSIYQDFVGVLSSSTTRSPLLIVGFSAFVSQPTDNLFQLTFVWTRCNGGTMTANGQLLARAP